MSKDYDGTIRRILTHIDYPGYTTQREALLEELRFFDLRSSPVYRFSLSNVFGQHADPTSASDRRIQMEEIRRNTVLQEAYREIFELMPVGS